MAKKSLDEQDPGVFSDDAPDHGDHGDGRLHITEDVRKAIEFVIDKMGQVKLAQEAIKDDINGIAAKMGVKPAQVKGIVNLVIKEQEKGGVLNEEEQRLEWTREVLEKMDLVGPEQPGQ